MSDRVAVLVADDEPIARAGLRRLLGDQTWLECVGEAANGVEARTAIESLRPDLVFLDIEMPGLSGLELLRSLADPPYVVFTTAYAEHAVTAFELGALDYLLKPFGSERLTACLDRVRAAFGEPRTAVADRLGEALSRAPMSRLFVRTGRSIVPISVESIVRFEAVGDYVAVHCGDAQHLLHLSLGRIEERLDARRFARIHRAHIVNLDRVAAFRRQLNGQVVAELDDGTKLPVSRTKAQELRALVRF